MSERMNENERFGSLLFNESAMKKYISGESLDVWRECVRTRTVLPEKIAADIADGMKRWALEKGATHYTHWFQPLHGETAEKHEGFLIPDGKDGYRMEFSRKELVRGEPDASSFPSGGLRSTFEARGYSAWDPTSYAFIKDKVLCIPTVFCAYSGEVLDKKTPLLRSCDALNTQAVRILRLIGDDKTESIRVNVGPEQEYFLIPKKLFQKRMDLRLCGRTLFGADAPKKQELEDHYYGAIKPEITQFMQEINEELWKLGICAKTEHNEVAPAQYEMAPFFTDANTANDQNQLTMEIMKRVADRLDLVCLFHEKPFAGVNGSGKHVNWSVSTDRGENLFSPGETPADNTRFLLFLAAFVKGVDEYSELLRCACAYAGNDSRLGGQEAPPAIISVFVGTELEGVIDSIIRGETYVNQGDHYLTVGKDILLQLSKDNTDRNRTSPVAFTGNKFEFRAVGSSQSIAPVNTVLNTAMACALDDIATELEKAVSGGSSLTSALQELLPRLFREHQDVVFNGNGYSAEWLEEAEKRGLPNLSTTVDALEHYGIMDIFLRQKVLSEREILARQEILLENYAKSVGIEGALMLEMARTRILPVALHEQAEAADVAGKTRALAGEAVPEEERFRILRGHTTGLTSAIANLEKALATLHSAENTHQAAHSARDAVLPAMGACREHCDVLERIIDAQAWPLPSYAELLWLH